MNVRRMLILAAGTVVLAGCVHPRSVDVGVRASGEVAPGVYGRVDIGNRPPPRVVYTQPVIIVGQPRMAPVYMHVPPGHAKNWSKHCHKYDACGTPVYFVKSQEYEPEYQRPKKDKGKRGDRRRGDDDDDD